jgi:dTDP-L-rhamnose 4-epimerase
MKALVTGGAGFVGSHTVDLLLERGYEVKVLDALMPPVHVNGVKPDYVLDDVEFIRGDVRDREGVDRALRGVDVVFHLAAYQDYLPDFSRFAFTNDGGTALLYELIVEKRYPIQKVVLASSQAVYGEGKYRCLEHGVQYPPLRPLEQLMRQEWEPYCPECGGELRLLPTDEAQVHPANQYAISKYAQELYALTLGRRYGIPSVAMRYSITQGPRQSFRNAYSGILRIFSMRLLNDKPPIAYEDGQQLRDYVSVHDVVQANLLVLEDSRANYQVFNVGGGKATTALEYAHLLARKLNKDIEVEVPGKFRFGDTRHIISDISKLRGLGWEPITPLDQIVEQYIAWAQAQPDLRDYYAEAEEVMKRVGIVRMADESLLPHRAGAPGHELHPQLQHLAGPADMSVLHPARRDQGAEGVLRVEEVSNP